MIRVAVADDHGVLRDGLAGVIGAQPDMELVATAADGAEAIAMCRSTTPDVVLMDLEMPVIDGAEKLDREQEALVYRVAQEAVRNVIAYADADSVRIELTVDDDVARLVISDDGRGFDPAIRERRLTEGHLGLSLVEELARDFGGGLAISSSEGAGTRVELEVPSR